MILTRPTAAPETARDLAVCLNYLAGPTPATDLQAAVAAAIGSAARVYFSPRSNSQPAFALATAGDWSFFFMEGASGAQQGVMTLGGYQGGLTDSWTAPVNSYFVDIKANVIAAALANTHLQAANVVCVGHSIGGAVAELVAGQVRETARGSTVSYCTFGAPKASSWPAYASVNRCVPARWFNTDDPVPLLMPTSADNLAMLVTFSIRENQRFSNFAQPFGGLEIGAAGQINAATYPDAARVDTITNIGAWLVALDGAANTPHSLQTYLTRLTGIVNANAANAGRGHHADHADDSGGQTSRELTDSQRIALQAIKAQEQLQHEARLNIPVDYKFQVAKLGKLWIVMFRDGPIATASRKRSAHSMARKINTYCQAVLKMGLVDAKAMSESMAVYLAAASDPASLITPKLQQSLKS